MRCRSIAAAVAIFTATACEDSPTEPFCANVDSPATLQLTSQTTATGSVQQGPLRGTVNAEITSLTPGANNTQNAESRHVFIAGVGDTLFTRDTGVITPTSQAQADLSETLNVERGTGRFRSAQGSFASTGTIDGQTGQVQATFTGQLCGLRE
jgi:ABC-type transport system substrate-binding protein